MRAHDAALLASSLRAARRIDVVVASRLLARISLSRPVARLASDAAGR